MATIQIKNIGPLVDTGVLTLNPVMLFIGKQSTGKSTLMKIICFCRWVEKQIMIGEENLISKYTHYNRFFKEMIKFHRLSEDAFSGLSYILYEGDCISIRLDGIKTNVKIVKKKNFDDNRYNTKLSFIPAERCLISAIDNIDKIYRSSELDMLFNYIMEWNEAREIFTKNNPLNLVFDPNMLFYHDSNIGDVIKLRHGEVPLKTFYASSGVQSAMPILAIVGFLASLLGTSGKKSPRDYMRAISRILYDDQGKELELDSSKLNSIRNLLIYKSMQLYVEEPEQNLFPQSQKDLIFDIIKAIKLAEQKTQSPSYLVMTTHSPYVLTTLNQLLLASRAMEINSQQTSKIVSEDYILPYKYYSAYSIESDGTLTDLIDIETGLIMGEYLDEVSENADDITYRLNEIIYANAD